MQRKLFLSCLVIALLGLTACNTVEGLGEDIQKGGRTLERAAQQNK